MEKTLETYKKTLAQRQVIVGCGLIFISVCVLVINYFFGGIVGDHVPDFIHGFQLGLFTGLELLMVFYVVKLIRAQKNDDRLRKMYISEHDERSASIRLHTFATSGVVSLVLIAFAAIVAGFFDEKICLTLIVVLIVEAYIKLPFKIYYSKKY